MKMRGTYRGWKWNFEVDLMATLALVLWTALVWMLGRRRAETP